jgi:hypothetical protein
MVNMEGHRILGKYSCVSLICRCRIYVSFSSFICEAVQLIIEYPLEKMKIEYVTNRQADWTNIWGRPVNDIYVTSRLDLQGFNSFS